MSVTSQKVELNRTVSLVVGATTKGDKLAAGDTNPASAKTLKQLEEAKAHLHRAERKVRPSFKRWKPRFSQAGEEYCKAAILFYQCGVVEESKTNLLKACECFKKKRAWYSAAKTLEQAMTISLRQGELQTTTELAWRSAALFRKSGQPDSAAQLLERASKAIGQRQPENSIMMLEEAAETVETENRPIQAASYVNKLLRMALENSDIPEAIEKARKLVELYQEAGHKPSTGRNVLGLVLLLLNIHRTGEAEIVAREFGNNCSKEQNILIEDLLDAYDQNDMSKISSSLKNPVLSTLDVEFKSIFENMTLPQLTQGIRPRSRTRRNFSVCKDAGDKKTEVGNEETTNTNTSNSSRVNSEDEAMRGKDDVEGRNGANNNHVEKIKKKAPICKGEDFKTDEEEEKRGDSSKNKKNSDSGPRSDHEARVEGTASSIPMAMSTRKKRNPLVKMHTHDASTIQESLGKRNKHHDHHSSGHHKKPHRSEPSAYIDVTTDSVERHRPGNLPGPAPYVDVDGIDPIQPAYMGMTVEQWRAFKRSNMADENEFAIDDSLGNIGDGSDW